MNRQAKIRVAFCTKCNEDRPVGHSRCLVCRERVEPSASKFKNVPEASKHGTGRIFQSKRERAHEPVLLAMRNAGLLSELQYQERFRLDVFSTQAVEALLEFLEGGIEFEMSVDPEGWVVGAGDRVRLERLVKDLRRARHHVCDYIADYTFLDEHGRKRIHDPKGYRTPVFAIKKRLVLACQGLEVEEV